MKYQAAVITVSDKGSVGEARDMRWSIPPLSRMTN